MLRDSYDELKSDEPPYYAVRWADPEKLPDGIESSTVEEFLQTFNDEEERRIIMESAKTEENLVH